MEKTIIGELACPKCQATLSKPVTMPCGHHVCGSCITVLSEGNSTFNCPVCSTAVSNPQCISNPLLDKVIQELVKTQVSDAPVAAESVKAVSKRATFPNLAMRDPSLRSKFIASHPDFFAKLNEVFPGALPEMDLIAKVTTLLQQRGFVKGNAIPIISACRDELTRSLVDDFEELWGPSFSTGSIGGMVFAGKTGLSAGMGHAPQTEDGKERYIFVSSSHIAISEKGEIGKCFRLGRSKISHACGAVVAFLEEIESGNVKIALDTHDMEQSMMKQQLLGLMPYGEKPSLESLTKTAQKLIRQQLENTLAHLKLGNMEFGFLSGVQIHGPENANFFWPCEFYIEASDGSKENIDIPTLEAVDASAIMAWVLENDQAQLANLMNEGHHIANEWKQTSEKHK